MAHLRLFLPQGGTRSLRFPEHDFPVTRTRAPPGPQREALRQPADDPLLRLPFAIITGPGNLSPLWRLKLWAGVWGWPLSGARPQIGKGEVDDESWCGLSADRARRRYRGGQGV